MTRFYYDAEIETAAHRHGLDPALVKAVVLVESAGKTHAYRFEPGFWLRYMASDPQWDGANPERVSASYGLMQVMYSTARQHGFQGSPEHMFVPLVGLEYGCLHLKHLLDKCLGHVEQALAQYNGGERGNTAPPYRNGEYARKVLKHYNAYKGGVA